MHFAVQQRSRIQYEMAKVAAVQREDGASTTTGDVYSDDKLGLMSMREYDHNLQIYLQVEEAARAGESRAASGRGKARPWTVRSRLMVCRRALGLDFADAQMGLVVAKDHARLARTAACVWLAGLCGVPLRFFVCLVGM